MDNLLLRIQHSLILNSKFISDIGLFNGKMGIIITFANLYIKSGDKLYYDIMEDLLEDVLENIYMDIKSDFGTGIAGIGWGIEYLRIKGLVESDSLCLYEEINKKIMETDIRRITDMSLETGMEGFLHYIVFILLSSDCNNLPFDKLFLSDLNNKVLELLKNKRLNIQLYNMVHMYNNWYKGLNIHYDPNPASFVLLDKIDENIFCNYPLGLRSGISGWLLNNY